MMKICIIGYYHLADGYLACSKSFEKAGFEISFFPLITFRDIMNLDAFFDFLNGKEYPDAISPKGNPDILLFWIPVFHMKDFLKKLREQYKGKMFWFNWDPCYINSDHHHWKNTVSCMLETYSWFDHVFSVNPWEVNFLISRGIDASHCYPGFNEDFSYPIEDDSYRCDVSAVITNLYVDELWDKSSQRINRKTLLDQIYADKSIVLHIYGPEFLRQIYPDSYRGFLPYDRCHRIFSNSRINLCIHAISIDYYLSERAPQIIASGGLLFIDNQIGLGFLPDVDYVLTGPDPYQQVKDLLEDENKRKTIAKNGYEKRKLLSWENFAEKLKQLD